jgi:hypothetical protein
MTQHKKIIYNAALGFVLLLILPTASAQTDCMLYPEGSTPLSGYGAAWDVFDPSKRLLIAGGCTLDADDRMPLRVGVGDPNQAVYKDAYSYKNGRWNRHSLAGTVTGDWIIGQGTVTPGIQVPANTSLASPYYFVGYVCTNRSGVWKCGCSDTACTSGKWQLQAYTRSPIGTGGGAATTSAQNGEGIVAKYGPRTVNFQKDRTGGGVQERYRFTPADQYYLDYTLRFHDRFDWDTRPQVQGKIPGLAGGGQNGGGNCTGSAADAWSARSMFHQDGAMKAYLYYSNKTSTCGDKEDWTNPNGTGIFKFIKNRYYRFTQRIKINTPNVSNGEIEIWIDGQRVFYRNNMRWRGDVSPSVARVDQVMYQAFFGGESINHTPTYDSSMDFGWMYVMSCRPDFSRPAGTCANE